MLYYVQREVNCIDINGTWVADVAESTRNGSRVSDVAASTDLQLDSSKGYVGQAAIPLDLGDATSDVANMYESRVSDVAASTDLLLDSSKGYVGQAAIPPDLGDATSNVANTYGSRVPDVAASTDLLLDSSKGYVGQAAIPPTWALAHPDWEGARTRAPRSNIGAYPIQSISLDKSRSPASIGPTRRSLDVRHPVA
jgi:hypothetical protein